MVDKDYMKIAINLANDTGGNTSPNPKVGCIIVKEGQIVGIGSHLKAGEPHAEVHALNMAGDKAKGSTVYVTLEPCNHTGKTPPCTEALIKAEVARVVIASTNDPNPMVSGKGVKKLLEAGIEVTEGILEKESLNLNNIYNHFIRAKKPYVTLKTAISLDGKIATSIGDSKWITNDDSRKDVHKIRSEHDAILLGINTVINDDPLMNVRLESYNSKQPIKVILDSQLKILPSNRILSDKSTNVIIFTSLNNNKRNIEQLLDKNVEIIEVNKKNGKLDLNEILHILGSKGISSLLVESGSEINASFLNERLVNKLICYIAPKLIGGTDNLSFFGGKGILKIKDAIDLKIDSINQIGDDVKIVSYL